jgi:4-hydroxybenzoate polyprenyltransferase
MVAVSLLRLVRWPGAITAAANAMTGFFVAHPKTTHAEAVAALAVAAGGAIVYTGGVVLNDVADAERDRSIHPGRPIPSGDVTQRGANTFGLVLLVTGAGLAMALGGVAAGAAMAAAALFAFAYDFAAKDYRLRGAAMLALARASNALAGVLAGAVVADAVDFTRNPLPAVYVLAVFGYTAMLTLASTFEGRTPSRTAAGAFAIALFVCAALPWAVFPAHWRTAPALAYVPLVVTLIAAARGAADPAGPGMGLLVRTGVFGFLLADSAWLFGAGRYDTGFALLLGYVALRFALARARS